MMPRTPGVATGPNKSRFEKEDDVSLFHEVFKRLPIDIDTALDAYGKEVVMSDARQREAFMQFWVRLNLDFAHLAKCEVDRRAHEFSQRIAAARNEVLP